MKTEISDFFFPDPSLPDIYTLSLHDALPISTLHDRNRLSYPNRSEPPRGRFLHCGRSEEHTSELQSRQYLVCRLLLEKKKTLAREKFATTRTWPPNRSSFPITRRPTRRSTQR